LLDLHEEEKKAILSSETFYEFFDQSTKIIERALHDTYDYTVDYRIGADTNE